MRHLLATGVAASLLAAVAVAAGQPPVFSTADGAIAGYDTVAYFTLGKAVKGDEKYTMRWRGADWYFSTPEHLAKFEGDPNRYAPRFGGYCAYAMRKGNFASVDPGAWTLHRDRLYLNFSPAVRAAWRKDIEANIAMADAHWKRLFPKL